MVGRVCCRRNGEDETGQGKEARTVENTCIDTHQLKRTLSQHLATPVLLNHATCCGALTCLSRSHPVHCFHNQHSPTGPLARTYTCAQPARPPLTSCSGLTANRGNWSEKCCSPGSSRHTSGVGVPSRSKIRKSSPIWRYIGRAKHGEVRNATCGVGEFSQHHAQGANAICGICPV